MIDINDFVDTMVDEELIIDTISDDGIELSLKDDNDNDDDEVIDDSDNIPSSTKVESKVESNVVKGKSKVEIAREIYVREVKLGKARKDIIAMFIAEAGLTKAGASTYYAQIKAKYSN